MGFLFLVGIRPKAEANAEGRRSHFAWLDVNPHPLLLFSYRIQMGNT